MVEYDRSVPFFTFGGEAEKAVNFYVEVFSGSEILEKSLYEEGMPGEKGKVLQLLFTIKGRQFRAMDIEKKYWEGFKWGYSTLVYCDTEPEFDKVFKQLSEGGTVMMGPEQVMDLRKVAWVTDIYGLTWQLVWE